MFCDGFFFVIFNNCFFNLMTLLTNCLFLFLLILFNAIFKYLNHKKIISVRNNIPFLLYLSLLIQYFDLIFL